MHTPEPVSAPHRSSGSRAGHIPSLDGIRALAIVIVFAGHCHISPLIPGGFGVTLFFFLSGYLITTLLTREFEQRGEIRLRRFYARRILRLSPPLMITLALGCALHLAGLLKGQIDPETVLAQIFYAYNYWSLYLGPLAGGPPADYGGGDTIPGMGIYWSLSVEEHFYLIWPALFMLFARKHLHLRHLAGLIALILIWRSLRVLALGTAPWAIYTLTDTRIDMLLFGSLLALLEWRRPGPLLPGGTAQYALIGGALGLLLLSFLVRDDAFRGTLRFTLQGLALMPLFHYACAQAHLLPYRLLNWRWLRGIGHLSYTIYLSHYVIILALLEQGIARLGSLKMVLLAAGLTGVYAGLMFVLVERPLGRWRKALA